MKEIERFITYCKIDTQANDKSETVPSTAKQKNLGKYLVKELIELGLKDAFMDEFGNVYAHLGGEGEKIAFNAHIDTALEVTGENVNPRIINNYDGKPIKLNEEYVLTKEEFPSLNSHIGKDLVVTDGNTLLGADDKAGIAIIMSMLDYLKANPDVKHHPISICFTCDEEIGRGPDHFDIEKMDADYGYTIDGGDINNIDYINFNAQGVVLNVQGVSVHPGEGKNALINALLIVNDFINGFPKNETPYDANEDDGYWHVNSINGTSDEATLEMILREFDKEKLAKRDLDITSIVEGLKNEYPKAKIDLKIFDQYENMGPYIKKDPRPINKAVEAMKRIGLSPKFCKIRGGTDGATISKMGLVMPNLGTGSANHHGRYEYLVVQDYLKMIELITEIVKV